MLLLKQNSKGDAVVLLQELLQEAGYTIAVTGIMNTETVAAVKDFQLKNNLVSDGIVFTKTWTRLLQNSTLSLEKIDQKFLSESAIISLADQLGLETAVVKAVNKVESSGRGFLIDGRPKILFEGHIFWSELKKRKIDPAAIVAGNENVLYPKWTKRRANFSPITTCSLRKEVIFPSTAGSNQLIKAKISSGRFCIGVPVNAKRYSGCS